MDAGGRVEALSGGSLRIWLQNQDIPGLAMTRSIGDKICREIGLLCTPEILVWNIVANDKFVIIASDGVWDHISSQEAVDIVASVWKNGKSEACCEKILTEAVKRWENNSDSVDDITVVIIFLSVKS